MMKTKLAGLALALLMASIGHSTFAYAQDATAEAPEAAPQSSAPNWLVTCSNQLDGTKLACSMSQSVVLTATGARLMTAVVQPTADGHELALVLPFGLDLQAGVKLVLDEAEWQSLPVSTCEAGACYSSLPLDAAAIDELAKGNTLDVKLVNRQGEEVSLGLTLSGFTTSLNLMG